MKSRILSVCFIIMVVLAGITSAGLVTDDFEDGDYTANPAWTVNNRTWEVVQETGGNDYLRMKNTSTASEVDGQIVATGSPKITNGKFELTMRLKPESTTLSSNSYQRAYVGEYGSTWTPASRNYQNSYYFEVMNRTDSGVEVKIQKWLPGGTTRPILAQTNAYSFDGSWVDVKFTYDSSLATNNIKLYIGDMLTPYLTATDDGTTNGPLFTNFDSVALWTKSAEGYQWGIDDVSVVPEPATMVLLGFGSLLLFRKKV